MIANPAFLLPFLFNLLIQYVTYTLDPQMEMKPTFRLKPRHHNQPKLGIGWPSLMNQKLLKAPLQARSALATRKQSMEHG